MAQPLTPNQIAKLQNLAATDRVAFYIQYYEWTGNQEAIFQVQIASLQGFYGTSRIVRHRTTRSTRYKGCISNKTALSMIVKLAKATQKKCRGLDGHK